MSINKSSPLVANGTTATAKAAAATVELGLFQGVNWEALQKLPDPTRMFSWIVIGFPLVRFLHGHEWNIGLVISGFFVNPYVLGCLAAAVATSYFAAAAPKNNNDNPLAVYDRWTSEWYWWNAFLYHGVMDGGTGSFCGVPVMLQQYQVLDRRFITHHSVPYTVGVVEFVIMQPCCLALVWAVHRRSAFRFPLEIVTCCLHMFGCIMFVVAEYYEGQLNVPSLDPVGVEGNRWANVKLDFYHFMYYWFGFWFCNLVWIAIPSIRLYRAFAECIASLEATKRSKKSD